MEERLIVILGPTAVGKTNVSIGLAKQLNTEIISGDSMLVYRGMNIGTAKPSLIERQDITHHLIDILDPTQEFSVTMFREYAAKTISQVCTKGKIPILAGGTGLYVKALLEGYQFNEICGNEQYRAQLEKLAAIHGNGYIHSLLASVDAEAANRLHPNDIRRIIRALEVYHFGRESVSQSKLANDNQLMYDAVVIGLTMERCYLYERINLRVDTMIQQGLIEEVANLLANGVPANCQAMKGIGYKEIVAYLHGEVDRSTAIDNIKKATRHFAKRQLTWYRKMSYIHWIDVTGNANDDILLEYIYNEIAGKYFLE